MTQPFLYARARSSSHSQISVFKEIDMQLVQVGSDFGTDDSAAGQQDRMENRVIHWENDLYCVGRFAIWKYDVANSGDWGVFHAFSTDPANAYARGKKIGLTPASIDGSGVLVCAYANNTSEGTTFVTIDKDLNVEEHASVSFSPQSYASASTTLAAGAISWRNKIVFPFFGSSSWDIGIYDLKTRTASSIDLSSHGFAVSQPCIFKDKVYFCVLGQNGVDTGNKLYRLDGTTPTLLASIGSTVGPSSATSAGINSLVEVGGKLFLLTSFKNSAGGWEMFEIILDSNGGFVDAYSVTSITLPSSLSGATTGQEADSSLRIDNISNSGIEPIYEFLIAPDDTEGSSISLYRWTNAPSGTLGIVDAGLDRYNFTKISTSNGTGGGRVWTGSGTLNVSQPDMSLSNDALAIDAEFTVYGVGQTGVALELLFDKEGEVCETRGTIGSSTIGVVTGNRVTELVADGITKVSVRWEAVTDGIVAGDNPKLAARVFIP